LFGRCCDTSLSFRLATLYFSSSHADEAALKQRKDSDEDSRDNENGSEDDEATDAENVKRKHMKLLRICKTSRIINLL
jgi:hypothetical protein